MINYWGKLEKFPYNDITKEMSENSKRVSRKRPVKLVWQSE